MAEGRCKFCGEAKKLIKAHVLPKKFFSLDVEDDLIAIGTDKHYEPRCSTGVYDTNILCKECDGNIGNYDQEAQKLFLSDLSVYEHKGKDIYEIPSNVFNHSRLRLFFISMIWRASISSMPMFKNISLGPKYEKIALDILKNPTLDNENLFSVFIFKLKEIQDIPISKVFIEPYPYRHKGIRMYCFVFSGYSIHMKVDNRKLDQPILFWKPNSNLFILKKEPKEELAHIDRISTKHRQLKLKKTQGI